MFQPVSSKVDFPAQEERILSLWKAGNIFEKSVAQRQGAEPFILYEGPPTANGNPGIHHVLARVFKDIMPRYKAMKGFYAPRRAGWDTHGLPVELEVEKTLGFSSKTQIEEYGVEKFNKHCRDSVFKYLDKWVELTERIGFWVDLENPYVTLKNEYIETGWWIIKDLWDKKLLYQGFRVTPHCPRCGTSLSSHEVALGYRDDADDPSVYVKFRVDWKQSKANLTEKQLKDSCAPVINYDPNTPTYLLAWTTTPWTLTGNVALAISPDSEYCLYDIKYTDGTREYLIFSYELQSLVFNPIKRNQLIKEVEDYWVGPERFKGKDLLGFRYQRLYNPESQPKSEFLIFHLDQIQKLKPNINPNLGGVLEKLGWDSLTNSWKDQIPMFLAWAPILRTMGENVPYLEVNENETYVLVKLLSSSGTERLILSKRLLDTALNIDGLEILAEFMENELIGLDYANTHESPSQKVINLQLQPLLCYANRVVKADFVSMSEGTGIVHIAPAFGADDFELGRMVKPPLPIVQMVNLEGKMLRLKEEHSWDNKFVKEADKDIIRDLSSRNLLFRSERIVHTYPFCWRCSSPLLYYAKPSWYIRTSAKKQDLIDGNQKINWYPDHIKEGRFGDWLRNNVDWALSRERYWGTPLPVWRCQSQTCRHEECIGSKDELKVKPGLQGWQEDLDLHRPYIDQVTFKCPKCGGTMHRVPEVLDCWFDSGAMPLAQWHYPFFKSDVNERYQIKDMNGFNQWFPADYICEAVDQTRGWFYTLHALSTLVKGKPCFKNVICLGLILDARGEKMSKAKGNVVDPWKVIKERGADALRWYMLTASPPGNVRRFDTNQVTEVQRQFLLTLWNTYSFFVTYALIDKYNPATASVPGPQERPELDRWILSELNMLIQQVTERLDNYDPTSAGRAIADFVDNLSNWYVRRSRRRFWKSENDADKLAAYATLYNCLVTLCKLLAPFTPFMAEELYQNLVRSVYPDAPESVHLAEYPVAVPSLVDEALSANTRAITAICSLGRAARSVAGLKVRQPLKEVCVTVISGQEPQNSEVMSEQIRDELNVKEVIFTVDKERAVSFEIKPNLPLLGPKYGNRMAQILDAIKNATPEEHVKMATLKMGRAEIPVNDYVLQPDELILDIKDKPGYKSAFDGNYIVSVNVNMTPELKAEGLSREIVHRIQTMRRSAGFDIADYIVTYYDGQETIEQIMQNPELASYIRQETLSRELRRGIPPEFYKLQDTLEKVKKSIPPEFYKMQKIFEEFRKQIPPEVYNIQEIKSLEEIPYTEKHKVDGQEIALGVKKYI